MEDPQMLAQIAYDLLAVTMATISIRTAYLFGQAVYAYKRGR